MTQVCKVCTHPQCTKIEEDAIARVGSLRDIAKRYDLSASSLHRHVTSHIPQALARAAEASEAADASSLLDRVRLLEAEAWSLLRTAKAKAETADASPATLQAASGLVGRLVDVLTLFGKLSGELMERSLVGHVHRVDYSAAVPPALALQYAAEELCDRASELDETTRRALVVRLLEPPAIAVLAELSASAEHPEALQ